MLFQRVNDSQGQMLLLKRGDSNGHMFTLLLQRDHNTAPTDKDDDDVAAADDDDANLTMLLLLLMMMMHSPFY